jgi:hypothetical protein
MVGLAGSARASTPPATTAPPATTEIPSWMLLMPGAGSGNSPRACAEAREFESARFARGMVAETELYMSMGDGYRAMAAFYLAAFVPNVGMQFERGSSTPGLALSWSATMPFGPVTACRSSRYGSLQELYSLRAVIEGGLVFRSPVQPFLRPALRAIWHRTTWPLGVGLGLGSTLAVLHGDHGAASISPELLFHYGGCCGPGYFQLSVRGDLYYPRSEGSATVASLGFVAW